MTSTGRNVKEKSNATVAKKSSILNINIGILGHVDSGKTSLVKALSTSLSTAALDKNPQSQARGITIDLGFSAFQLEVPKHIQNEVGSETYKSMQFTLVDCPGHASLIRTIIGGAQIIDMMILVVDANKGIQTQTAECIIIGEMTTDKLIIVLNKIDMILPVEERAVKLARVVARIRRAFATTKFHDAPIIATAAAVGGEKVASVGAYLNTNSNAITHALDNIGMDSLVDMIKNSVMVPHRRVDMPFYYSIDHCFAIKGHGTVLTGTVLSGSISAGGVIEFPELQLQRKVKSMQMFHKTCKYAQQGDRIGMCVTNLDPTVIERGIAAAPNSVPLLSTVVCLVKKIRFFKQSCKSESKFHITVGHTTVIAKATFFGAEEIRSRRLALDAHIVAGVDESGNSIRNETENTAVISGTKVSDKTDKKKTVGGNKHVLSTSSSSGNGNGNGSVGQSTLSASSYAHNFPSDIVSYNFDEDFEYQKELVGGEGDDKYYYGREPVQWVLLELQTPVYCPLGSLIIGSRLDMENKGSKKSNNFASKRNANINANANVAATAIVDDLNTNMSTIGDDKINSITDMKMNSNLNENNDSKPKPTPGVGTDANASVSIHDQLAHTAASLNSNAIANAPAASDLPTLPSVDIVSKSLDNTGVTGPAANAALVNNASNSGGNQIVKQCRLAFYGPIKGYLSHNNGNTTTTSLANNVSHSAISPLFSFQDNAIANPNPNNSNKPELIRIFNWKQKYGEVFSITDEHTTGGVTTCSELVGWKVFSKGGNLTPFLNMLVEIEVESPKPDVDLVVDTVKKGKESKSKSTLTLSAKGSSSSSSSSSSSIKNTVYGVIYSIIGTSGKFKVRLVCPWDFNKSGNENTSTPSNINIPINTSVAYRSTGVSVGSKIALKFKRYIYDTSKSMKQDMYFLKAPPLGVLPPKSDKDKSIKDNLSVVSKAVTDEKAVAGISVSNTEHNNESDSVKVGMGADKPLVDAPPARGVKMVSISQNTMFKVQLPVSGRSVSTGKLVDARRVGASTSATTTNTTTTRTTASSENKRIGNVTFLKRPQAKSVNIDTIGKPVSVPNPWNKTFKPTNTATSTNNATAVISSERGLTDSPTTNSTVIATTRIVTRNDPNTDAYYPRIPSKPSSLPRNRNIISKSAPKPRPGVWGKPLPLPLTISTQDVKTGNKNELTERNNHGNNIKSKGLRFATAVEEQCPIPASGVPVTLSNNKSDINEIKADTKSNSRFPPGSTVRTGVIDSIKSSSHTPGVASDNIVYDTVIVSQAFSMEENIKQYIGAPVRGPNGQCGEIIGPYAKMGKCKINFPTGLSPAKHLKETVEILLDC